MGGIMKKKSKGMIVSFLTMCALSAGNIFFVHSGVWDVKAGTPVDLSGLDTAAYQVDGVSRNKAGDYLVSSHASGFQSDILVSVTFDAEGTLIRKVEVLSQAETEGLGTQVTGTAFLGQFEGVQAPVRLSGMDTVIVSPGTGEAWGGAGEGEELESEVPEDNRSNPEEFNSDDQSPETAAVRNLYRAGLLASAASQQPLETAFADWTPEEQAAYRLTEAGLTAGMGAESQAGLSAENAAKNKLDEAGLTTVTGAPEVNTDTAFAAVSEVDAVSGATISSSAVVQAVDQAYFFVQENMLNVD